MAHELGRPAGPVVVAHLQTDAVVYGVELREAATILRPDIGAGSELLQPERRGLVSRPARNEGVAKLPPYIHETRGLSCGRVDDVEATWDAIAAILKSSSSFLTLSQRL